MQAKSKAETFLGFSIKANKYRIGLNAIQTLKKINLIIICKTTADNSKKKAIQIATKMHSSVIVTVSKTLEELTHKENAKVMAIYDQALAKAILENIGTDFKIAQEEKLNG